MGLKCAFLQPEKYGNVTKTYIFQVCDNLVQRKKDLCPFLPSTSKLLVYSVRYLVLNDLKSCLRRRGGEHDYSKMMIEEPEKQGVQTMQKKYEFIYLFIYCYFFFDKVFFLEALVENCSQ